MLLGVIGSHLSPEGTDCVRVTLPTNPLADDMVIVAVVDVPLVTEAGFEEVTRKSGEAGLEKRFVDCILTSVYST